MSGGYAVDVEAIVTIHANTIARPRSRLRIDRNLYRLPDPPIPDLWSLVSVRFRLLTEPDVRAVLTMDDLIETMASALERFSSAQVVAARASHDRDCRRRLLCDDARLRSRRRQRRGRELRRGKPGVRRRAWREAGDRLRRQHRARPAHAPGHHRPARSGDRRAAGAPRRPLHHRGAHGRGIGRVVAPPRARDRLVARDHRVGRPGAQPPGRAVAGAPAATGHRLEPAANCTATSSSEQAKTAMGSDDAV